MPIDKNKMQNIRTLYNELVQQQTLEIGIMADTGIIDTIITTYAKYPSLYKDPKRMESLINKLDKIILNYAKTASKQGQLLSQDALDRFLQHQERVSRTAKERTLIKKLSAKRAEKRLKIYSKELVNEGKHVKNQIDDFIAMQRNMGRPYKTILQDLVDAGKNKTGIMQGLNKKVKNLNVAATRIEKGQAETDNYKLYAKPKEPWQWITVSKTACPDCKIRAGKILPYRSWQRIGLPRAGATICKSFCLCRLYPLAISEDKFPTVKEFRWNSKDLVLTAPSVEKLLVKGSK